MFTELVRIGCSFLTCLSGSAKYQLCLIFQGPYPTLDPDHGSANLETVLCCLSTSCSRNFLSCPILLLSFLEALLGLS